MRTEPIERSYDLAIRVNLQRSMLPDSRSGLMKDHGQQASENFAGPVDFETPRPDLPVHF